MKKILLSHKFTILSLLVIVSMFLIVQLYHQPDGFKETIRAGQVKHQGYSGNPNIGGEFELIRVNGEGAPAPADESLLADTYSIIFFGFTYCPDVCPMSIIAMSELHEMLPANVSNQLQYIFVTIDPDRDNPETLREYLAAFSDADTGFEVIGLTGTQEQIAEVGRNYLVYYTRRGEGENYLMDHSSFAYVMGPDGKYITHLKHGDPVEMWATAVQSALYK